MQHIIKGKEEDFELLSIDTSCKQDNLIPHLSCVTFDCNKVHQREKDATIMDFVIEQETYIILDAVERDKICSQNEWKQFISRKTHERKCNNANKKATKSRVSYVQRNTIIEIKAQDIQKRKELWSIVSKKQEEIEKQQQFNEELSISLPQSEEQALARGVVKIKKIFKSILKQSTKVFSSQIHSQSFWTKHLKLLEQNENQLIKWIENTLYRCAFEYKQIRYCKGLEYICLGIIFAYPHIDYTKYSQIFNHFLSQLQFEELYLQGSPRFYCQLRKITQSLKKQNASIHNSISKLNGDSKNLFITYYRSCFLYRLKNAQLIRKIFQLLFAQGIAVIKTVLLRIMHKMRKSLLQGSYFLQTIASFLIIHYFSQCSDDDIRQRLKVLFEM